MSVALHLISKRSHGLFHAAIVQSEPFGLPLRTTETFPPFVKAFAKKAKCTQGLLGQEVNATCLLALPTKQVIDAQQAADSDLLANVENFLNLFVPWTPVVGTAEVPVQPLHAFQNGDAIADVPVVMGTVTNEALEFVYSGFGSPVGLLEYDALLAAVYGLGAGKKIRTQYPAAAKTKDYRNHMSVFVTDSLFHCATRNATLSLAQALAYLHEQQ